MRADEALERLKAGNARYVRGEAGQGHVVSEADLGAQDPVAVVVGCSDARVPVEMVLGQGWGELFVVRVAGHAVGPKVTASVAYGVVQLGVELVVVMGHRGCGAVSVAVDALTPGKPEAPGHLEPLVRRLKPSVQPVVERYDGQTGEAVLAEAVKSHVHASVDRLTEGLRRVGPSASAARVVGSVYDLETGWVQWLEGDV
ncbi:MAG: carbonic anhydrase [Planctomycetota bacterium]